MASTASNSDDLVDTNETGRPTCKYGAGCYRSNPQHLEKFCHPVEAKEKREGDQEQDESEPKRRKLEAEELDQSEDKTCEEADDSATLSDGDESADLERLRPETPPPGLSPREEIKWKFKMEMPEDFYNFWKFCQSQSKRNPRDALRDSLGLQLVGPYDVLAGDLKWTATSQRASYCLHWRYYYDPPEFQTVLRGDDATQHHLGYYRDSPSELPVFVAANSAKKGCSLSAQGDNIFAAVKLHMDSLVKATKNKSEQKRIAALRAPLVAWANKCGHCLDQRTPAMKSRDKKVVAKTFHGAGIVVPVDANEVGYRELPETDANLKRILKKISQSQTEEERNRSLEPLDEILCLVQFANDECDYGQGYELGLDLFAFGHEALHGSVRNLLPLAYTLLGRPEFGTILEAHLEDRRTEGLSML